MNFPNESSMIRRAIGLAGFAIACAAIASAQPDTASSDGEARAAGAVAQSAESQAEAVPASVPIPGIAAQSDDLRSFLRESDSRLANDRDIASIGQQLPESRAAIHQQQTETQQMLSKSPALEPLTDAERSWLVRQRELGVWRESLAKRASAVQTETDALDARLELWKTTLQTAEQAKAPDEIRSTIRNNIDAVEATRRNATASRDSILTLMNSVTQQELIVSDALASIRSAQDTVRSRILEPDSEPLWSALMGPSSLASIPGRLQTNVGSEFEQVWTFFQTRRRGLVPVALAFGGTLVLAFMIRSRLRRRQPSEALAGSVEAFARPYSIAAICAFLAGVAAFPFAPSIAINLVGAFLLLPLIRVVYPLVVPAFRPILYFLSAFYLMDRVRDVLDSIVLLERLLFFVEALGAAAFLLLLLRPHHLETLQPDAERAAPALAIAIRIATGILAASALANLLGYVTFSRVLGEGLLKTGYVSVLFYAAFRIGLTAILVVLSSSRARRLHIIETQGALLLRWSRLLLLLGLLVVWADSALSAFAIRDFVVDALSVALTTPLTLGSMSVSLGDLLGFAITVLSAVVISRVIRVLLGEDILPRLTLGRGVANAISTSVHYLVLLGGFFLALGAAGVDFSRFALLAGAFGVGIGFGLQNVVNNFVSGLILLFERPIQVGDAVEVGGLLGEVKRIGIRASLVRTYQGAEVIVPNGNLISTEVTNWTLSDHHRRVEIPVGVAYGNRPADVIEIFERVVSDDPRILQSPAPMILFRGFGDSSLNFEVRFWAPDYMTFLQLSSDVSSAIYDALAAAQVVIPFPQRDLHLQSVDPSVLAGWKQRNEDSS